MGYQTFLMLKTEVLNCLGFGGGVGNDLMYIKILMQLRFVRR